FFSNVLQRQFVPQPSISCPNKGNFLLPDQNWGKNRCFWKNDVNAAKKAMAGHIKLPLHLTAQKGSVPLQLKRHSTLQNFDLSPHTLRAAPLIPVLCNIDFIIGTSFLTKA